MKSLFLVLAVAISASAFSQQRSTEVDSLRILFFGDSITEGWMDGELKRDSSYVRWLSDSLNTLQLPFAIHALGRGGETTEDALSRFGSDVLARRPAIVLLAFGSNDMYIHGYATEPRVDVQRFSENVRLIVRRITLSGGKIILVGLPPLLEDRFAEFSPASLYSRFGGASALRSRYDSVLQCIAKEGALYTKMDFAGLPLEDCLGRDGVHPTPRGHRWMAHALWPVMQSLLGILPRERTPESIPSLYPNPFHPSFHRLLVLKLPLSMAHRNCTVTFHNIASQRILSVESVATSGAELFLFLDGPFFTSLPAGVMPVSIHSTDMYFVSFLHLVHRSIEP